MNGSLKLALLPWDARYMDGDYTVKAALTNANDASPDNWSDGSSFQIDNFKPFIRSVGIYSGNGTSADPQIYYREWIKGTLDGKLRLAGMTSAGPADLVEQVVTVYALASEPLRSIKAKISNLTNANIFVPGTVVPGTDGKKWSFQFSHITFTVGTCYELVLEGEDLHGNAVGQGNQLLDLPKFACGSFSQ